MWTCAAQDPLATKTGVKPPDVRAHGFPVSCCGLFWTCGLLSRQADVRAYLRFPIFVTSGFMQNVGLDKITHCYTFPCLCFLTDLKHLLDVAGFQVCCSPSRTVLNTPGQEELHPALCARGCCRKEHPCSPFLLAASVTPACFPKEGLWVPALRTGCTGLQVMDVQKDFPREPCWRVLRCACCRLLTAGLLALHSGCAWKAGARLASGVHLSLSGQPAICLSPPACLHPACATEGDKDGRSSHCNLFSSDPKAGSQLSCSNLWAVPNLLSACGFLGLAGLLASPTRSGAATLAPR